jgi:hypothetical protein
MAANTANLIGTVSSSWEEDGTRTYAVEYEVETTDANDQGITARLAPGVPRRGTRYQCGNDWDASAYAKTFREALKDRDGSVKYWVVTVGYSSKTDSQNKSPQESYDYPWLRPARVSGSGANREMPLRRHYADPSVDTKTALKNSAGHFFDDEFYEESDFGITIEKDYRLTMWNISTVLSFVDCVNSITFWDGPQDYYRMLPPAWSLLYTGEGLAYVNCRFEFAGRYGGWNGRKRIDDGYMYRLNNKLHRFEDDQFRAVGGKGLLDGSGGKLPDGANPVFRDVNPYLRKNFAELGVPTSIYEV